jgi:hypothetical protein
MQKNGSKVKISQNRRFPHKFFIFTEHFRMWKSMLLPQRSPAFFNVQKCGHLSVNFYLLDSLNLSKIWWKQKFGKFATFLSFLVYFKTKKSWVTVFNIELTLKHDIEKGLNLKKNLEFFVLLFWWGLLKLDFKPILRDRKWKSLVVLAQKNSNFLSVCQTIVDRIYGTYFLKFQNGFCEGFLFLISQ